MSDLRKIQELSLEVVEKFGYEFLIKRFLNEYDIRKAHTIPYEKYPEIIEHLEELLKEEVENGKSS